MTTDEAVSEKPVPGRQVPFPFLLSPLEKGRLSLRNRVMFSGHMTLYSQGGVVSPRLVRYYEERARGGVGAIVTEAAAVHPSTVKFPEMMRAYEPAIIPSLDTLGDTVHNHGAKILLQLAHGGSRMSAIDSDMPLLAPSAVKSTMYNEVPHALDLADIAEIRASFAMSAANAARSSVDGVEVHSAHGYLPVQFLSPLHNRRTDAYGGSLENRARFLLEVLEQVRVELGDDKLLGVKLNGSDLVAGGCTVDDYVEVTRLIEATGTVDYISVSAGTSRSNHRVVPAMPVDEGVNVDHARKIHAATDISIFSVGRIYRPDHAESLLADGWLDGVAMARALIADPQWVNKAAADPARIRPCIAVNQGCFGYLYRSRPITCLVNPRSGKESRPLPAPAQRPRRVAVVGGGPAGCEAAMSAAERGHHVVVYESRDRLGGLLNQASSIASRRDWLDLLTFQRAELAQLGVDVLLNTTADAEMLTAAGYDDIVLAIGSATADPPTVPPGGPKVLDHVSALSLSDVDGFRVVLVDEVETMEAYVPAEHLAERGADVLLVTSKLAPGGKLDQPSLVSLMERLGALGVNFNTSTRVCGISADGVSLADVWSNRTWVEPCTHVVWAGDRIAPARTLADALAHHSTLRVHEVGDCVAPRSALEAIREGRALGEAI